MTSTTLPIASQPAPLSEMQRITGVFVSPARTFADMKTNASWWAPLLITILVSLAFAYVVDTKIGFDKVMENQVRISARAQRQIEQLPPAQRADAITSGIKRTRIISYAFFIFVPIQYAVVAGLLLATFKFGAGADLSFKTAFAILWYAGLANTVRYVLCIIAIFAGFSPDGFMIQNPLGTNPGFYMDPTSSVFLYSLASALDIFMIWTLVLRGIGFAAVSKVTRTTAIAVVFGWWALLTLLFAGIGAAFN